MCPICQERIVSAQMWSNWRFASCNHAIHIKCALGLLIRRPSNELAHCPVCEINVQWAEVLCLEKISEERGIVPDSPMSQSSARSFGPDVAIEPKSLIMLCCPRLIVDCSPRGRRQIFIENDQDSRMTLLRQGYGAEVHAKDVWVCLRCESEFSGSAWNQPKTPAPNCKVCGAKRSYQMHVATGAMAWVCAIYDHWSGETETHPTCGEAPIPSAHSIAAGAGDVVMADDSDTNASEGVAKQEELSEDACNVEGGVDEVLGAFARPSQNVGYPGGPNGESFEDELMALYALG